MELLSEIREKYLLETSLEELHQESMTWLNTVYFWDDENKFYKDLLSNKLFQYVNQKDKSNINTLLDIVISNKLSAFKNEVSLHEKNLNTLLRAKLDVGEYRHKHKLLLQRFTEFDQGMKDVKTGVFELLKLVNSNYFNGNETMNCIYERRAVRKYKKNPIDKYHIEKIIYAGSMAPSAMDMQPWKFFVLTNKEKIKLYSSEISKVAKNVMELSTDIVGEKNQDPIFYGAPVVIFITAPKNNEWAGLDIGMCVQNMMLASKSLGYDSCPVGLSKAIERTPVYSELKIPKSDEIKLSLVIGYGDEKPEARKRTSNNLTFLN